MPSLSFIFFISALIGFVHGEEESLVIYSYHPPEVYEEYYKQNGDDLRGLETNNEMPELPKNFTNEEYAFTLFNWNHRFGVPVSENNSLEELQSLFDSSVDTKIVVHGWLSSASAIIVNNTIECYLSKESLNAVAVDWSTLAGFKIYPVTSYSTIPVGKGVAALVKRLVEAKVTTPKRVHLIGHSLGAHVMGIAGDTIFQELGEKVSRITGLDPAAPMFEHFSGEASRLGKEDAEFVDVIHTAAGLVGYGRSLGHADFYPNSGSTFYQPACQNYIDVVVCSHGMSYKYYDESITNPKSFRSVQCESWEAFNNHSCDGNAVAYMGDPLSPSARGDFYLKTNAEPPYGKG